MRLIFWQLNSLIKVLIEIISIWMKIIRSFGHFQNITNAGDGKLIIEFQGPWGTLVLKKLGGPSFFFFFFRVRFGISDIFYTSGIEMSQHVQGPFEWSNILWALTKFWGQLAWGRTLLQPLDKVDFKYGSGSATVNWHL